MRPPVKKPLDSHLTDAPQVESRREGLAEKRKLAQHLHDQGINPLRWTDAHPAPQSDQATFRTTGRKPKDNQFEVGGKLYDWSPAVTATPQQAKAIADAYIAERSGKDGGATSTLKIEDLVDIGEVPLKHPFGTPHHERPANDMSLAEERTALIRHYAQAGVDPDKAHLGDPVDVKGQERMKAQIEKTPPGDKSEISGLPLFYQGFDDGWIYRPNASTQESEEVQRIRLAQASAENANDNDPELVERVVQHYLDRDSRSGAASPLPSGAATPSDDDLDAVAMNRLRNATAQMPQLIAIVRKTQAGEDLSDEEEAQLADIKERFAQGGIVFAPLEANPDYMEDVLKAMRLELNWGPASEMAVPFHVAVDNLNVEVSQGLLGGTIAAARVARGMPLDRMKAIGQLVLDARLNLPAKALLTALNTDRALDGPLEMPDIFEGSEDDAQNSSVSEALPTDANMVGAELTDSATPSTASAMLSSSQVLNRLSSDDVADISRIFVSKPSTFNRTQAVSMPADKKADLLTSGMIDEIELFGLPIYLADPRGNEQTQDRIDKLKKMVRNKLVECGMEESFEWGGRIEDEISKRAKERFVPPGEKRIQGASRADLSFRISWLGKTYIIDINTVDVLKNGSMTKAERVAAEGLRLNRLIRLSINETLPEDSKLDEFEGKIGTVPKGKDMTDEEWEAAAKEWVDSFLDCDGPLEADVYLDPESKHPWPGKE
ncbi:hypothetical protein [Dongia sp.]|uniref:hypothetical protein n=1 Tax=Dongia sp. TaxID=1977262 RepID=UPI0034A2A283